MGTLHNAIIDAKQQPAQSSSSSQTSSDRDRGTKHKLTSNQSSAVRFVPRTTHLENRKRKIEEAVEHSPTDKNNEPLIGPKLPEPPKLDMEDESLNTTVNRIRNTMKQVADNLVFSFRSLNAFIRVSKISFVIFLRWNQFLTSNQSRKR